MRSPLILISFLISLSILTLFTQPGSQAQTVPPVTTVPSVYLPVIANSIPTATPTPTSTPLATETSTPIPPTATATAVPAPDVAVVSSNIFNPAPDVLNDAYLVGEVVNHTNQNVQFVKINAVLRDDAGKIVDGGESYAQVDKLSPGMTSGFRIIFSSPPAYRTYELVVTWDTSSRGPFELQVSNQETYFDGSDAFHVRGNVTNQSSQKHTFVRVFMVMYDANNRVIGTEYQYLNPTDLEPGQTLPFDIDAYFWKGKPDHSRVSSYSVHAYDD